MHPAIAKQKEFLKFQLLVPANQAKPNETNEEERKKSKKKKEEAPELN
jgi:hypothetical protein